MSGIECAQVMILDTRYISYVHLLEAKANGLKMKCIGIKILVTDLWCIFYRLFNELYMVSIGFIYRAILLYLCSSSGFPKGKIKKFTFYLFFNVPHDNGTNIETKPVDR